MRIITPQSVLHAIITPVVGSVIGSAAPLGVVGMLDGMGALAGYGLRQLLSAYAGPCCNVRRSSDNATQDIGFTANGDLDAGAFGTFVGAGSGFVTAWYDQIGSANVTQATTANQPQLLMAQVGGKPALSLPTTQTLNATLATNANVSVSTVMMHPTGDTSNVPFVNLSNHLYASFQGSGAPNTWGLDGSFIVSVTMTDNNYHSACFAYTSGGTVTFVVDGTSSTVAAGTNTASTTIAIQHQQYISELVIWNAVLSLSSLNALHASQAGYYGVT